MTKSTLPVKPETTAQKAVLKKPSAVPTDIPRLQGSRSARAIPLRSFAKRGTSWALQRKTNPMRMTGIPFGTADWSQIAPTEHPGEKGTAF